MKYQPWLTLTWDVFKCKRFTWISRDKKGLTLTWDVFKCKQKREWKHWIKD